MKKESVIFVGTNYLQAHFWSVAKVALRFGCTANVLSAESTDECLRTKSESNYIAAIFTDQNKNTAD